MISTATTTTAALAIAALLTAVAARLYRHNHQLRRQIAILEGANHLQRLTIAQTEEARNASTRALNEVLLANSRRPPSIMRFNGVDYAQYKVKAYHLN